MTNPDKIIDGILQRRFCYSMTGATGAGKTAIALPIASHVDRGARLGGREVPQGRVLYCAGENPDDVRMRWIGMGDHIGFDPENSRVHFREGIFRIKDLRDRICKRAQKFGKFSLVVVDAGPAFFEGTEENANKQMGGHARMLRSLTGMPGGPTVLVCTHPPKNAGNDGLVPRGGGALLNEMDSNLTCAKDDTVTRLHWLGKFRGPDFASISFELLHVMPPSLLDSRGRQIPTVVATVIERDQEVRHEKKGQEDKLRLLRAIRDNRGATYRKLCSALGWPETRVSKVGRIAKKLEERNLITRSGLNDTWSVTEKGKRELRDAETPV